VSDHIEDLKPEDSSNRRIAALDFHRSYRSSRFAITVLVLISFMRCRRARELVRLIDDGSRTGKLIAVFNPRDAAVEGPARPTCTRGRHRAHIHKMFSSRREPCA